MNILTPKALPWAMCLQAFQAALRIQADNHLKYFVDAKVNELEKRKKSDKCCNYLVYENDGEYIIDFLVSDGADGMLNVVEADIHHYKPVVVDGKKAIHLNFYSRRAYGDDIIPFLESLKEKKVDWIKELTQMKIVCKVK